MDPEHESDMMMDQETFISRLALEILEGRSFDITGRKCSFEKLFHDISKNDKGEEEQPLAEDEKEELEKEQEEEQENEPDMEQGVEPDMEQEEESEMEEPPEEKHNKVMRIKVSTEEHIKGRHTMVALRLKRMVNEEFAKMLQIETENVATFRKRLDGAGIPTPDQIKLYKKQCPLENQCRQLEQNIKDLQTRFKDYKRLGRVTAILEALAGVM